MMILSGLSLVLSQTLLTRVGRLSLSSVTTIVPSNSCDRPEVSLSGSFASVTYLYLILAPLFFHDLICGPPDVWHFLQPPQSKNCISCKSIWYLLFYSKEQSQPFLFIELLFVIMRNDSLTTCYDMHIVFKCKSHLAKSELQYIVHNCNCQSDGIIISWLF